MPWQDVCLSVRLSVTRRYYVETAKCILKLISSCGSSTISTTNVMEIIRQWPRNGGVECRSVKKWRFSTNISLYLGNNIYLLWNANRNSYAIYRNRMMLFSVTLSDFERLAEILNCIKHRAVSLRQRSFLLKLVTAKKLSCDVNFLPITYYLLQTFMILMYLVVGYFKINNTKSWLKWEMM